MATTDQHNAGINTALQNGNNSTDGPDFEKATQGMSHEEKHVAQRAARFGYGPLAHMRTNHEATLPGIPGIFPILNMGIFETSTDTICSESQHLVGNSNPGCTGELKNANSPTPRLWDSAPSP